MPKSKKNKVVHLTQVKKKGKDHKEDLTKQIEQYVEQYKRVFLIDLDKAKSDRILALRMMLKDNKEGGRLFAGRNSLSSVAFKNVGTKTSTDYERLLEHVSGHTGLLFTDSKCKQLVQTLAEELPEFRKRLRGYGDLNTGSIVEFKKL